MKIPTKKYALIYNGESKMIIFKINNNSPEYPTYPANGTIGVEFDTEQELDDYISENNLVE
ncbi:hypothetical protein [Epilithonimonas hungarica]|uniref:Uncharacterized protein n=1 Tax=Epilithonimonas hungarica TaxID=454006 RepID=A0A1G7PJV4_9FLAO|nr:hypothetical protein [Epilithonimonas hungarica]SDF85949.1 hypothetical protein SAMN05421825_2304 [Epilithonimonas hungarica]